MALPSPIAVTPPKSPLCVTRGHDLLPEIGGGQHLEMKRSSKVLAFGKIKSGHSKDEKEYFEQIMTLLQPIGLSANSHKKHER